MQFDFIPRGCHISSKDLLADLRRVAGLLGRQSLTADAYLKLGRFVPSTSIRRFAGWNAALLKAGLTPVRLADIPAKDVLADIRRVAAELRTDQLTGVQYEQFGKYSRCVIYRHFQTWSNALQAAGMPPSPYVVITHRQLFDNLEHLWRSLGRQPRSTDLCPPLSRFSITPYVSRFGSFHKTMKAFAKSMANKEISPLEQPDPKTIHRKPGRAPSTKLRYQILKRDHYRCQSCGRSPAIDPNVQLEVDHIKPWSKGGQTIPANLQTLCQICNAGKKDL